MRHSGASHDAAGRVRQGEGTREDAKEVIAHLLAGCRECKQSLAPVLHLDGMPEATQPSRPAIDYANVFARVDRLVKRHQLMLAEEEASVPELLGELERHPWPRKEVLVSNSSRFHVWPLVEVLLQKARRLCQREPSEAESSVRLAILTAELLDRGRYGENRVQDLLGRAWGELGNILRVQERLREAESAFLRAHELLRLGTGDPVEKANLLNLEASLRRDRRQFDQAFSLLDRSIAIARKRGERRILREALIRKAHCNIDRGSPEVALASLLQAQGLLDSDCDERLHYVVQHNILFALIQAGRFEEAAAGLEDTRRLCERLNYPIDRIRLGYLEGRILQGLGELDEAERRFRTALQSMLAEGLDYDAALVGLDLATLLSQQNRHAEVRQLVAAMLPVFTSQRIHREAIAALLIFKEAVQRERLSAQLVDELSAYLRSAASDPDLRFQPPVWLKSSKG